MKNQDGPVESPLLQNLDLLELVPEFEEEILKIRADFSITQLTSKDSLLAGHGLKAQRYNAYIERVRAITNRFRLPADYQYLIDAHVFFKPLRPSGLRSYSIEQTAFEPGVTVRFSALPTKNEFEEFKRDLKKAFNNSLIRNYHFPHIKQKPRGMLDKHISIFKRISEWKNKHPEDNDKVIGIELFGKESDFDLSREERKAKEKRDANNVKQIRKVISDEIRARKPG